MRFRIDTARFTRADVAGEAFVLDQRTGRSYRIGGSGPWVWGLLRDGATVDGAAGVISSESGAPIEVVLAEVQRFVDELRAAGILDVGEPA